MAEEIERADLARVYRAIGNSKAPMPDSVTIRGGILRLQFPDGDEASVNVWAHATGGTTGRSFVRRPPEYDSTWHQYGTSYGSTGMWLGWTVYVDCFVYAEHPAASESAVLGTGDQPADEAIVPASDDTCPRCAVPTDPKRTCAEVGRTDGCPECGACSDCVSLAEQCANPADDVAPNAGSAS